MKLYNTRTRQIEKLKPKSGNFRERIKVSRI